MAISKDQLRKDFAKDWKKHYDLQCLKERGLSRHKCKNCGKAFWSVDPDRKLCGEPACVGYGFIGNSPTKEPLDQVQSWKSFEKFFVKNGHKSIPTYPAVARWRSDLYFTIASITDFQPYVVSGEIDPPANPLVVPQICIRFGDVSNVGVSGRHHTGFTMLGQHAFNSKKTGLFYWKDQAMAFDYDYVKDVMGVPEKEIVVHEDVWAGGGNFGPCMEIFVQGDEIFNCVFMQFEETKDGYREMDMKIVDMGAGLERQAWLTQGTPTIYDAVFPYLMPDLKKQVDIDWNLFLEYAKLSGVLNVDEVKDIEAERKKIAKQVGLSESDLHTKIAPLQGLYSLADHTRTLLYAITDGQLPSNSGGGYNLRLITRRALNAIHEYGYDIDIGKIFEKHAKFLEPMYPHLMEGVDISAAVWEEEEKKYAQTKETGRAKVISIVEKLKKENKKEIPKKDLVLLYDSYGVPVDMAVEIANKEGMKNEVPADFYSRIADMHSQRKVEEVKKEKIYNLPDTKKLYYEKGADGAYDKEFEATVLEVDKDRVILGQTLFYPEGGGQEGDTGYLDDVRVSDTQKSANVIYHIVENPKKFKKGQKVKGKIDWDRRFQLMQNHSGAHILLYAAKKVLGDHVWQAGAKKSTDKAHLDLTHYKRITDEELKKIEDEANKIVKKGGKVEIQFMERDKAEAKHGFKLYQGGAVPGKIIRVVDFVGYDAEACGGTHVRDLKDIKLFKIIRRKNVQDGRERIEYVCGNAAEALKGKPVKDLEKIKEEKKKVFQAIKDKAKEELESVLESVKEVEGTRFVSKFFEGINVSELEQLSKKLAKENNFVAVLACSEPIPTIMIVSTLEKFNAVKIMKEGFSKQYGLEFKGGGNPSFARGIVNDKIKLKGAVETEMKEFRAIFYFSSN
ncbi:MAG: alanine--tRNA ligase, partial [Candidatus Diapherotrites archaeon]|nr:alanine--tRNA ligase [Candidatus Diapherotrites archaeon]